MFVESWRKALIALAMCLAFIGGVWFVVVTVQVPQYTNMTDEQSDQQTERWFEAQVQACQNAGGEWQVGFSSANCSIVYTVPDTSWYVAPQDNPNYLVWEFGSCFLIALAICTAIMAFGLFLDFCCLIPSMWRDFLPRSSIA